MRSQSTLIDRPFGATLSLPANGRLRERLASGRAVRSCDLGIGLGLRMKILAGYGRHEIFEADATEAFSLQVAYGLGRFGQLIETTGHRKTSAERIRANSSLVLKPGMRFSPGV